MQPAEDSSSTTNVTASSQGIGVGRDVHGGVVINNYNGASGQANEGLSALSDLIRQNTAIRQRVQGFQHDLALVSEQIDALGRYKGLHDLLHRLQFNCYNPLAALLAIPQFVPDLWLREAVRYGDELEALVQEAHTLAASDLVSPLDVRWIEELVAAQGALQQVLPLLETDTVEAQAALAGVSDDLKGILRRELSSLNTRLNAKVRDLRLSALLADLQQVQTNLGEVSSAQQASFSGGLTALTTLHQQLTTLMLAHDGWQRLVDDLWVVVSESDDPGLKALRRLWARRLQTALTQLCTPAPTKALQDLAQDTVSLADALASANDNNARRVLDRLNQRANRYFSQLDKQLKDQCHELRQVSVAQVLKALA